MATTKDLLNYENLPGIWLEVKIKINKKITYYPKLKKKKKREDHFDSALVEAGPLPLKLSDGNFLFLYNSARAGYPSPKPNWDLQVK
jgi:predicted GH43/DUF377 family glycosyl hydrolase